MNNLRKLSLYPSSGVLGNIAVRLKQDNASLLENLPEITNRNPRNLELMTIARKPMGYHLEVKGREYWHKLFITTTGRHTTGEVHHFENGCVVSVSTQEWALKKQLYKTTDVATFMNLGRVLAQRCLECGITSMYYNTEDEETSQKVKNLLNEIQLGGVSLTEPKAYKHPYPWKKPVRPIKPWTLVDE